VQSALRKDIIKWNGIARFSSKQKLAILAFYTNLHYETPGGLNLQQFDSFPSQARAGAAALHTGVYNQTAFTGLSLQSFIGKHFFQYQYCCG